MSKELEQEFKNDKMVGSPITRLFLTKEHRCPKCKTRRALVEMRLSINNKNQMHAMIIWRCKMECELNLKKNYYQLLAPSTIAKLKKKKDNDKEEIKKENQA